MSTTSQHEKKPRVRSLLAIDPSSRALGWAAFGPTGGLPFQLLEAGFIRQEKEVGGPWLASSVGMAHQIGAVIGTWMPEVLVIECPSNWFSAKGTASKDAGDIQKLYATVGAIVMAAQRTNTLRSIWCASPEAWKGQTPKHIMVERAVKYVETCGLKYSDKMPHDVAEAVLMGRRAVASIAQDRLGTITLRDVWDLVWARGGSVAEAVATTYVHGR